MPARAEEGANQKARATVQHAVLKHLPSWMLLHSGLWKFSLFLVSSITYACSLRARAGFFPACCGSNLLPEPRSPRSPLGGLLQLLFHRSQLRILRVQRHGFSFPPQSATLSPMEMTLSVIPDVAMPIFEKGMTLVSQKYQLQPMTKKWVCQNLGLGGSEWLTNPNRGFPKQATLWPLVKSPCPKMVPLVLTHSHIMPQSRKPLAPAPPSSRAAPPAESSPARSSPPSIEFRSGAQISRPDETRENPLEPSS